MRVRVRAWVKPSCRRRRCGLGFRVRVRAWVKVGVRVRVRFAL